MTFPTISQNKSRDQANSQGGEIDYLFMGRMLGRTVRLWIQGRKEHATLFTITSFIHSLPVLIVTPIAGMRHHKDSS